MTVLRVSGCSVLNVPSVEPAENRFTVRHLSAIHQKPSVRVSRKGTGISEKCSFP